MKNLPGWRLALLILGLALLSWMVMDFNSRMAELNRLRRDHEQVLIRAQSVQATKSALEAELAFAYSEAAVEKWAYEQGHMVRPGDILVVPVGSGSVVPTPTPQPMIVETEVNPPQSWMALFFGP